MTNETEPRNTDRHSLLIDRLHCIEGTPEWTPDEVYLLVAVAATRGRAELRLLSLAPGESWQGLRDGQVRPDDILVDADFSADKLYVAALLERDGARDFDPPDVQHAAQRRLDEIYRSFASIRGVRAAEVAEEIRNALDATIRELRHDDDFVGGAFVIAAPPPAGGQVLLSGPQRRYRIWFKLGAARPPARA